jgi:hypothetical protein
VAFALSPSAILERFNVEKDFSDKIKKIGDEIANLNFKTAEELNNYLKEEYGIEPVAKPVFAKFLFGFGPKVDEKGV